MPMPVTEVPADLPTLRAATPTLPVDPTAPLADELVRQLDVAVAAGVAALAGTDVPALRRTLVDAAEAADGASRATAAATDRPEDHVPALLVLAARLDPNDVVPAMRRGARHGVSVIGREEAATYRPLPDLAVPTTDAYLLLDVDTGSDLCDVPPEDALRRIRERGRTPLTLAEGLALVVARPDLLRPGRCFSLPGSRPPNQRVPAIWISERRPKLGWCWDRNPHTWLGSASAAGRVPLPLDA